MCAISWSHNYSIFRFLFEYSKFGQKGEKLRKFEYLKNQKIILVNWKAFFRCLLLVKYQKSRQELSRKRNPHLNLYPERNLEIFAGTTFGNITKKLSLLNSSTLNSDICRIMEWIFASHFANCKAYFINCKVIL